jgi:hypothetical protein
MFISYTWVLSIFLKMLQRLCVSIIPKYSSSKLNNSYLQLLISSIPFNYLVLKSVKIGNKRTESTYSASSFN